MLDCVRFKKDLISEDGTDCRNYGLLDGIIECRRLMANLTGTKPENVFMGGNASLNMMYIVISNAWTFGINGGTPWSKLETIKFLCPVSVSVRHWELK